MDLDQRELRNRGVRVRLQHKPFQVLELLLKKPGILVRREELMEELWPGLNVNFEGSLNTAVNTLRQVLGDSPRHCRFIETRPGLGYRFLMPVEPIPPIERSNGLQSGQIIDFEAQQDYLKGRYFYSKVTEDDLRKSIAYFESAIAQDSEFALAYAGLADAYSLSALLGMVSPEDACCRAKDLALTALGIDDRLPEGRVALAITKKLFDRDWPGAESECLRALKGRSDYAGAHQAYAAVLAVMGRLQEAVAEIRRAQEIDAVSVVVSMEMAWILYLARDFQAAIEQSWKALILEPKFAAAQHTLGLAYEQTGMIDEAIAEFQNARVCSAHNPATIGALGHALSLAGRREEAMQCLDELDAISQRRYVSPYWQSIVHAGLRNDELACQSLNRCMEQGDVWLNLINVEPRFDPIRSDTRFNSLIDQLRFNSAVSMQARS